MSFEDVGSVDVDLDEGTFTIIRNSGAVQTYYINDEPDLYTTILRYDDEVEVNFIE